MEPKSQKSENQTIQDLLSLSPTQEGMLFHYILGDVDQDYCGQLALTLRGDIKVEWVEKAWEYVVQANEMLRTFFRWEKLSKPVQVIRKTHRIPLQVIDLSSCSEEEQELQVREIIEYNQQDSLDIRIEPIRLMLLKLSTKECIMIIKNHHILYDGWSTGIILKEFLQAYNAISAGIEPEMRQKRTYKEFIKYLQQQNQEELKQFWRRYLEGFDQKTSIPTFSRRQQAQSGTGRYTYELDDICTNRLNHFIAENRLTLATVFYTAWGLLLQRYAGTDDVVFGTTVSGRNLHITGIEEIVGLFINTIPLRVQGPSCSSIQSLMEQINRVLQERLHYEQISLVDIKSCTTVGSLDTLFDSIVVVENYPLDKRFQETQSKLRVEPFSIFETTNYSLTLVVEVHDAITIQFGYKHSEFDDSFIQNLTQHLCRVLTYILAHPENQIAQIDFLSKDEKKQILYAFNDTYADYPRDKTVHQLFLGQAVQTPERLAVVCADKQLTYWELHVWSDYLAKLLQERGVRPDTIVGIVLDRSPEVIVGLLAILKAGGGYLPMDPDYPEERIELMLTDCSVEVVLTTGIAHSLDAHYENINLGDPQLGLDVALKFAEGSPAYVPQASGSPESLAYVIYTSGSTGRPKGVIVEHRNIVRLVQNPNYIELVQGDKILQTGTLSFDASTFEIWGALLNGLELHLGVKDLILSPERLEEYIVENQITTLWLTAPLFHIMAANRPSMFQTLKYLLAGGDVLAPRQVNLVRRACPDLIIINGYGPTENTTFSTCFRVDGEYDPIPVGKPVSNSTAYIFDSNNHLCPVGIYGELCVGGDGLARGYLKNPELTADKFVANPVRPGEMMYRTGDLARWLPDGNIEFGGRKDQQVKIRGFRIELGEVENTLLQYEGVRETVVLVHTDQQGNKNLCAYVVGKRVITPEELRNYLINQVPGYMIPTYFVCLEKMPLNPNGKIDRKALPAPEEQMAAESGYIAPGDVTEEKLAAIWSELLGVANVGIEDNFFDLGGHSLKATLLIGRIQKELQVELPLSQLFAVPTISGISAYIHSTTQNVYQAIQKVEEQESYAASSAQKRMYVLQQFDLQSTAYNITGGLEVKGKLELKRVERVCEELIRRHETLRTSFTTDGEEIVQRVHSRVAFHVEEINGADKNATDFWRDWIRAFDLRQAPLFRVGILRFAEEHSLLLFDMHHIISDGTSIGILIREFASLYAEEELPALHIQYKDYAAWQNAFSCSNQMHQAEAYWLDRFADELPVLTLPTDFPRSKTLQSMEGHLLQFTLREELSHNLRKLARTSGSTLYMVLLSGINILLSRCSGQEEIIVGSPIAGRQHPDVANLIGMFVNTLAMRNRCKGEMGYAAFLKEVRDNSLAAYEQQDYQFEDLVERLQLSKDTSRNPLFDVMFALQNMEMDSLHLNDLTLSPYPLPVRTAKFDLTILASERDQQVAVDIEYRSRLFKAETIQRMFNHFTRILETVVANPQIQLSAIELLTGEEKAQILQEFNATSTEYPQDKTIHHLFAEQVERLPDHTAVVCGKSRLTYRELDSRANRLAVLLRQNGVEADKVVGILANPSLEMIVGVMAILKAGGAYLPIDPTYPVDRIKVMVEDSAAEVILTTGPWEDVAHRSIVIDILQFERETGTDVACSTEATRSLDAARLLSANGDNVNSTMLQETTPRNLAYVIYTSGSTGKPKGVMVEHRSVVRLVKDTNYIEFTPGDKILQTGTLAFDASTFELWGALLNGLELHLGEKNLILSSDRLEEYIVENQITTLWLTAPLFHIMAGERAEMFRGLRYLLAGGDVLSPVAVQKVRKTCPYVTVINGYGPTENTTFSTCFAVDAEYENIPVGKPISNSTAYIFDRYNHLSPVGIYGELCVGGDGLARGYLNNSELTAEKFVPNPVQPGEMIYRTGDLARWLPDGNIEFLGRKDQQVKIRGFRIEPGEIENSLLRHEAVKEVVVVDRTDAEGGKYLCAYVVVQKRITAEELRKFLAGHLPHYMIPAYIIYLEKMPLNRNGKIDRNSLPVPDEHLMVETGYIAPCNVIEEQLALIWSELLGVTRVGVEDDFFELGGHSLKATLLAGRIHKEFKVAIPLSQFFAAPTIKGLSELIYRSSGTNYHVIGKAAPQEYYEASSAQKRIYLLQQFDLQSTDYNIPGALELRGRLDLQRVELAFQQLIQRHETLRTSFATTEEQIVQRVHDSVDWKVKELEPGERTVEEIWQDWVRPFDLSQAPLLRVGIWRLEDECSILLFDMHHIISDGTSMGILSKEFAAFYAGQELAPLNIQYKDYAGWQKNLVESGAMKKQAEFWLERFGDSVPVLNLPIDFPRPAMQSHVGASVSFDLDQTLTSGLQKVARESHCTLYMVLLSAVNILLAKYSGQEDIIIGSPVAGRAHADLQGIIGMFVNTLAMRNQPAGEKIYTSFLQEVRENSLRAFENQDYQFEELVEQLNISRDLSRNPLFDVMFALQNMEHQELTLQEISIRPYPYDPPTAKFDLTITANEVGERIAVTLRYCRKLLKRETVERLGAHLEMICQSIVMNPQVSIQEIELLTAAEKAQILYEFIATGADFPGNKTIAQLFELQVEKTPDNIAVFDANTSLTYAEFNSKANRLAYTLREKGVQADQLVGLLVDRSLEMMIAIFAILKAGGAYLPISPDYPEERVRYMLEDSQTRLVLAAPEYRGKVDALCEVICLDPAAYSLQEENLTSISLATDLVYALYTSGSTGKPKGVLIEHHSLINTISHLQTIYPLDENDTILQSTVYTFDASVREIFWWCFGGARCFLPVRDAEKDPRTLVETMASANVTMAKFVPVLCNEILSVLEEVGREQVQALRYLLVGGEALSRELVKRFFRVFGADSNERPQLINVYGPTEATIHCTEYQVTAPVENMYAPIGRPIANDRVYILDKHTRPVPVGVAGELYIAGVGLARSYLNNPDMTAEKFVENPFAPGERMYRTGDLVRWLTDGNIEFLGRLDQQVKIRGFRIELGEIESLLLNFDPVEEAVVLDQLDQNGEKYLCAYLVASEKITVAEVREFLLRSLPEYMVPSLFLQLEHLPLNASGKIDRKALPKPEGQFTTGREYIAPRNLTEEKLAEIWSELLGVDKVGIADHFFELGGHSLKATLLAGRVHKAFQIEVPLRVIFNNPTIQSMNEYIQNVQQTTYSAIAKAAEKEYYQVSSGQKRLYLLQQFDLQSTAYNMPGALEIRGELDIRRVEAAFHELIRRHETLRTSFDLLGEQIVQRVHAEVAFQVEEIDSQAATVEEIWQDWVRAFDLSRAPLLRVGILRHAEGHSLLLFDMHHSISDGTSMGILTREFATLYAGQELEDLRIQYKDFAEWQNTFLRSGLLKKQEMYWLDRFCDEVPVLTLPTDYPRSKSSGRMEGDILHFTLGEELKRKLMELARNTGSTLYMVLLSGITLLLARYSGQEEVIIGSPVAGRQHADLAKVIGMFVNTLAMRNRCEGKMTYAEFLKEVRDNALGAFENQDYQFEELVEQLQVSKDFSRNPLFDVMFTLQNMDSASLHLENLTLTPYQLPVRTAKFDLTIFAAETAEQLTVDIEYATGLFKAETIRRMFHHLERILQAVAANPGVQLSAIELITPVEKAAILHVFNDTSTTYPKETTIHQLFTSQVHMYPEHTAVVCRESRLTYRELDNRANRLAVRLRQHGVMADRVVGILAEPSLEMIVGVLAILKAGGAYMPVDPEYPVDRIRLMVEDSAMEVVLTPGSWQNVTNLSTVIDIAQFERESDAGSAVMHADRDSSALLPDTHPRNLAYVIYTSGSTGKPKGVMVEHRSVVRLVKNTNYIAFTPGDKILQTGTLAFDASTFELWGALLNGLELHLGDKNLILSTDRMEEYICENRITTLWLTAPLFHIMAEERPEMFRSLKHLLAGGDVLSPGCVQRVRSVCPQLTIINGYGPTENTTFSTCFAVDGEYENIPIGKPISNSTAYIFDQYNHLAPVGVYGELCVGGDGLARGYLNNPELTAEKFVQNPVQPGEMIYRTGDLARWLPDGNIEFLGRKDQQVKIRGFRIEPGEIENYLLRHEAVKDVVVMVRIDAQGGKYLCAYIVSKEAIEAEELRKFVASHLPHYMIPAHFICLETLPLTRNGKIDRNALPVPEEHLTMGSCYIAPGNDTEERLALIWSELLGIGQIGVEDDFFELGGHSLKATLLAGRIHKEFEVVTPLSEIFASPTIRGLSTYIQKATKTIYNTIEKAVEREYYQTTSAQKRLFTLQQLDSYSTGYNIPAVLESKGALKLERVQRVFERLIARHESLRTSFTAIDDTILQKIHPTVEFRLEELVGSCVEEAVQQFVRPFDLRKAPLLRVGVMQQTPDEHVLVIDMHHIISDGTSMGILVAEFVTLYEDHEPAGLRLQYKDYAEWQNSLSYTGFVQHQEEYWLNVFHGEVPVLNLPADYPRPSIQSFAGDRISWVLDRELTARLMQLARETGSTLYMVLLSGVNILLARYSGQEDIVVGSPVAGRPHPDLQTIIGMFVNTLALRNYPAGRKTYLEFLQEVRENVLKSLEHQEYPFADLVERLNLRRDLSRNPLFDVMFVLQNAEQGHFALQDVTIRPGHYQNKTAKFDLTFFASEEAGQIRLTLEYGTQLFADATVRQMCLHLTQLLTAITENSDATIAELSLLTAEEYQQILREFNNTASDMLPGSEYGLCVHQLFAEQVRLNPDAQAVTFGEESLTYAELNSRASRLAVTLRELGVGPEVLTGIMVERSFAMVYGILGIMQAGGAYLPVDPEYPEERIAFILQDSGVQTLLTQSSLLQTVPVSYSGKIIDLDRLEWEGTEWSEERAEVNGANLAYVIYTSGSTGQPKGVMVEHRNIVNTLLWRKAAYQFVPGDKILQIPSFAFDSSVEDILTPLVSGIELVLVEPAHAKNVIRLANLIQLHRITHFLMVPSLYLALLYHQADQPLESVKIATLAGEKLTEKVLALHTQWQGHIQIINEYGPTENAVCSTWYTLPQPWNGDEEVSIGRPIFHTQVYILDQYGQPVPIGVPGEIYLAGKGLARGYLQRPGLTAERFLPNPFEPGQRMYRTGDLAKFRSDGNMIFLGRVDHQVKIRGFRIELGEIEAVLMEHPAVQEAVVLDRIDSAGQMELAGYLVAKEDVEMDELRRYLAARLPEYMVPAAFVKLDTLPRTPNGKVDRNALLALEVVHAVREYVEPASELEWKLAGIWADILQIAEVGRTDHFFELGGHSLKATQVISRIYKELGIEIPLRTIFEYPVLADLAVKIGADEVGGYESIPVQPRQSYYPLSHAQKRLWILDQLVSGNTAYNVPVALRFQGALDREALNQALQLVIRRHESMRTGFVVVDNEPVQWVDVDLLYQIPYEDWLDVKDLAGKIRAEGQQPFDLTKPGLFRAKLARVGDQEHIFCFTMHHIISDGWSANVLIQELARYYNELVKGELPVLDPLPVQYRDYAVWQNSRLSQGLLAGQEYWLTYFAGELPVLELPTDKVRPAVQTFKGEIVTVELTSELSRKLQVLAREENVTLFMLMLAAYQTLLSRYAGQDDLIVGIPVAGRSHPDLTRMIGFFVNTLAIRSRIASDSSFREVLVQSRENILQAFAHQEYPFDLLVEKLELVRDLSRTPLFTTFFAFQSFEDLLTEDILSGISIQPVEVHTGISKFDLSLTVAERAGRMVCSFEYNTDLFLQDSIAKLGRCFETLLSAITAGPEMPVYTLPLITSAEVKDLLTCLSGEEDLTNRQKCLPELFAEQVARTPDLPAVRLGDTVLTYRQFNDRADQIADLLRTKGVQGNQLVGLMLKRSIEMLLAIIGIMKAGGAYLPIAPDYPEERIHYLLQDSQVTLLLTHSSLQERVTGFAGEVIALDLIALRELTMRECTLTRPDQLAYVIYTSGSTGQPKGVLVQQQGIVNSMLWRSKALNFGPGKRLMQVLSYVFDGSLSDFCCSLLTGAELVLVEPEQAKDVVALTDILQKNRITHLLVVPGLYRVFLEYWENQSFPALECVSLAGEALSAAIIDLHQKKLKHVRLINEYGPTENSVVSTWYEIPAGVWTEGRVPVGRLIPNTRAYLLDQQQQPVPSGVVGEIYLAGAGLALGYLNRPELTGERFIADPFRPGERMYRTGDLGRLNHKGQLEFIRRVDDQVKIRGLRIELGEIENVLLQHPAVEDAALLTWQDEHASSYLVAYVVLREMASEEVLKQHLIERLPEYMVPGYIMELPELPRLLSGKLNRKGLLQPSHKPTLEREYMAPRTELEKSLASIWTTVLGVERVGLNDNFFALGGHSLKATQVITRIHTILGVKVPLGTLFQAPTLAGFAALVGTVVHREALVIPVQPLHDYYPLSHSQKRIWMLDQITKSSAYNISTAVRLQGELNLAALTEAFHLLAERHDSLRTRFGFSAGEPVQIIESEVGSWLTQKTMAPGERVEAIIQAEAQTQFELAKGGLWRVCLVKVKPAEHLLILTMHHIISDGWSLRLLMDEFSQMYNAITTGEPRSLEPLTIQYRDYAVWQNQMLESGALAQQEAYWLQQLSGELIGLDLPKDQIAGEVGKEAGSKRLLLDADRTEALEKLAQAEGTTSNMAVTAVFMVLLHKLSGAEDITLGIPVAGRNHQQLEGVVGLFLNTLVLRLDLAGDPTVSEIFQQVKAVSLAAFENQDYPFDRLLEQIRIKQNDRTMELFSVMLNYVTMTEDMQLALHGLNLEHVEQGKIAAKFDLEMYVQPLQDDQHRNMLFFVLEYRKNIYSPVTIETMLQYLERLISHVITNPEARLSELNIYGDEMQMLLADFNDDEC